MLWPDDPTVFEANQSGYPFDYSLKIFLDDYCHWRALYDVPICVLLIFSGFEPPSSARQMDDFHRHLNEFIEIYNLRIYSESNFLTKMAITAKLIIFRFGKIRSQYRSLSFVVISLLYVMYLVGAIIHQFDKPFEEYGIFSIIATICGAVCTAANGLLLIFGGEVRAL